MNEAGLHLKRYYARGNQYSEPIITISKKGMSLNRACTPAVNEKDYCEIFYDDEKDVVALMPYHIFRVGSFKINKNIEKCKTTLHCTGFIQMIGMRETLDEMGRESIPIKATWNDKNKMFLLDLKSVKRG